MRTSYPKSKPIKKTKKKLAPQEEIDNHIMPLNKYIAHCGICSRREAVNLIKAKLVQINDKVITEPGTKVNTKTDQVFYKKEKIAPKQKKVYVLFNKPKDCITTNTDPEGRKTVFDFIKQDIPERLFAVGRLDRNTTGILLLTNDGELTQMLSHPKYEIKKIYHVVLDKPLHLDDFNKLSAGISLEDGVAKCDAIAFVDTKDKTQIGVEIHSGKNRIVRRMFEALNYKVINLDRVMYDVLTKKNVPRGKWRLLTDKEVIQLKVKRKIKLVTK